MTSFWARTIKRTVLVISKSSLEPRNTLLWPIPRIMRSLQRPEIWEEDKKVLLITFIHDDVQTDKWQASCVHVGNVQQRERWPLQCPGTAGLTAVSGHCHETADLNCSARRTSDMTAALQRQGGSECWPKFIISQKSLQVMVMGR